MDSAIVYSIKRWLRILDSRRASKTQEVQFRGRSFRFYSTYWWSDISQALLDREIDPYFAPLKIDFRPSVIIDVGAATGHFAILATQLYPEAKIYAFEPSERQRILLSRNAHLNGVADLEIESLGLWSHADELAFRTNGAESSFESVSRFRGKLPFREKVTVIDLDQWAQKKNVGKINLIKMDAEGAELEILEGARKVLERDHPRLLIQAYHFRDGVRTLESCANTLRAMGYETCETPPTSGLLYAVWPSSRS